MLCENALLLVFDLFFSVAFEAVGMSWAKYIVAFGALKGMTSVLLVGAVGQARYLTHIARTHLLPPWLAKVMTIIFYRFKYIFYSYNLFFFL